MTAKTIQLSTRVTDEDASFLARVEIEGAHTPSDKIRSLIGDARRRFEGARDYRNSLNRVAELLAPAHQELQAAEHSTGKHSELVRVIDDWLTETIAFMMSALPDGTADQPDAVKILQRTEQGLADRAFTLTESILRLGVTERAPCYNPDAISDRLAPVLALLDVIRSSGVVSPAAKPPPKETRRQS